MRSVLVASARAARRIVVATVGATVLAIGLALIVLPGPAFVVIPIGLGILGIEFAWARRWLRRLKDGASSVLGSTPKPPPGPPPAAVLALLAALPLFVGLSCRPGIDVGLPDPLSGEIRVEIETRAGLPGGPPRIAFDGADVVRGDRGVRLLDDGAPADVEPATSTRIGLSAGADLPWRWYLPGDPYVSARPR